MKRPPPVSHYPLHAAHASRYSSRSARHHAARRTPHAARRHTPPTYTLPPHAVHRPPPYAACRQSLVTLCPPPASRAHHLDEANSTDRACPVTALAPLPRPSPRYHLPRLPRRAPCIAPRRAPHRAVPRRTALHLVAPRRMDTCSCASPSLVSPAMPLRAAPLRRCCRLQRPRCASRRAGSCHASTDNEPSSALIPLNPSPLSPTITFLRQLVVISYATALSSSISSHTHTTCCRCRYHRCLFVCSVRQRAIKNE